MIAQLNATRQYEMEESVPPAHEEPARLARDDEFGPRTARLPDDEEPRWVARDESVPPTRFATYDEEAHDENFGPLSKSDQAAPERWFRTATLAARVPGAALKATLRARSEGKRPTWNPSFEAAVTVRCGRQRGRVDATIRGPMRLWLAVAVPRGRFMSWPRR